MLQSEQIICGLRARCGETDSALFSHVEVKSSSIHLLLNKFITKSPSAQGVNIFTFLHIHKRFLFIKILRIPDIMEGERS